MTQTNRIYVLGAGAVGLPLATYLASAGRDVILVRTSRSNGLQERIKIAVHSGEGSGLSVSVDSIPLAQLTAVNGLVVVTAKSYANRTIASALAAKGFSGPLVVLQNGIGVENPFLEARFPQMFRCVLYVTSQTTSVNTVRFRQIASCPMGVIKGEAAVLEQCVEALTTPSFQFHREERIQREIWKKAIVNSVFNSICPLLEIDNGIFDRDPEVAGLAAEIVGECVALAEARGISLAVPEVMEQIIRISRGSSGLLISTLQDIQNGRETEMEYLNLELARLAATTMPKLNLAKTGLLGRLVLAKSRCLKPALRPTE